MTSDKSTPPHEYAAIFALHEGQPLWDLSDRIKANGLREDIVTLDGKILDGRRRELGCFRAGVTPRYRKFGSRKSDGTDPLEFVIDTNLHRRHLGEGERAMAAARYATAKRGGNRENEPISRNANMGNSRSEAAERFDTSEAKVDRAKVIISHGTPELQEAVEEGTISVTDGATVAKESPNVQNDAVDAVKNGKAKTATKAAEQAKPKTPKSGTPVYDDRIIDKLIGQLVRAFDERGTARGKGQEHKNCIAAMNSVIERWNQWSVKTK